jgi:hypothetical protein
VLRILEVQGSRFERCCALLRIIGNRHDVIVST